MNSKYTKGDTPLIFPQFENEAEMTTSEICVACTGCCRYVAVGIDKPNSKDLRDQYSWFLLHRNVQIYIDNDNDWNLLFITTCTKLLPNGMCSIYEIRPQICKDYSADSCSRVGKDHKFLFETPEAMLEHLEAEKAKRKKKKEEREQRKLAEQTNKKKKKKKKK
ncbi:MAG: YkgJ family cysteine cluster protein [Spirochaetota bacterium]